MKIKATNYLNYSKNLCTKILMSGILSQKLFVDYTSDEKLLRRNFNRRKISIPKFSDLRYFLTTR